MPAAETRNTSSRNQRTSTSRHTQHPSRPRNTDRRRITADQLPELETWISARTRDHHTYRGRLAHADNQIIKIRYGAGHFILKTRDLTSIHTPADPHPNHRTTRTRHHGTTLAFAA